MDKALYQRVIKLLYSLTGITLANNKEVMINNRVDKLLKSLDYKSDELDKLLNDVKSGKHTTEFINTFTTNKTQFFREDFHFDDLKDRVLPQFVNAISPISIYCSASSTGEEPYSIKLTVLKASEELNCQIQSNIIATDIDTNVLQYASNGIYRYSKSSKEFPSWISPSKYFRKRMQKQLSGDEILIKVKDKVKEDMIFAKMNLNDETYPFSPHQFDVIFCRNVLIYFSPEDQDKILRKIFRHLKVGGTLYIGHSEHSHSLIDYTKKIGQNIFLKLKDID